MKIKFYFLTIISLLLHLTMKAQNETTKNYVGEIVTIEAFQSKKVVSRRVDVWLPEDYKTNPKKKYTVLYMHDGQNLFNPKTSYGGFDWQADEWATKLVKEGKLKDIIIVGIWNTKYRFIEYAPAKVFDRMSKDYQETIRKERVYNIDSIKRPKSDDYLKFIVEELKPFIDKTYRTKTDRKNTFIAGSSMGGLISLYALCEYPQIFGGAACVSTHWTLSLKENNSNFVNAMCEYLAEKLPMSTYSPKIYFDYGTTTLDAWYEEHQKKIDQLFADKKFKQSNLMSLKFEGAAHNEKDWALRFDKPLLFILGKK